VTNGQNDLSAICDAVTKDPTKVNNKLDKLKTAFNEGTIGQKFPLSIQYVIDHSSQLLAGGQSCIDFFNGLILQFQADLKTNGKIVTVAQAKAKLIELIKKKFES
jgi:hypothetical protein